MKVKSLFQALILLALMLSTFSASQQVQAKPNLENAFDVEIIFRDLSYWNATYAGTVNASQYEMWAFTFSETNSFIVTATTTSGDLVPLISLLDGDGNEIVTFQGSLTSTQPAGDYFALVLPQSGSGNYNLTIRKTDLPAEGTSASVSVVPGNIKPNESAQVTINLNNVPAGGLTSAEFTCTYDATLLEVGSIVESGRFGTDVVMAVNGPSNGTFIVAIAGSNSQKATTSGGVFTFSAKGLKAGQATITCITRISEGDQMLTEVTSTSATLTISTANGTLAGTALASKPVTVTLYDANNAVAGTIAVNPDGTFSLPAPAGTYIAVSSAEGFLDAQGTPTITSGVTTTLSAVSLPAGDIDGNNVIDQFDAMTIGMSYNTATPAAADLNNDGTINVLDLELLAGNYRKSGALAWQ